MQLNETMMNATNAKRNKIIRFPQITEDARSLGVNRATLYRTLIGAPGFDGLKTLRRRYDELLESKPKEVRDYINANKSW